MATVMADTKYEEHCWVCLGLSCSISVPYSTEGLKIDVYIHIHSHLTTGVWSEKHSVIGKYLKLCIYQKP